VLPIPSPNRLTDLEVYEVSLVPKGANNKQFLLFKSFKQIEKSDNDMSGTPAEPGKGSGTPEPVVQGVNKAEFLALEKRLDEQKAEFEKQLKIEKEAREAEKAAREAEQAKNAEIQKKLDEERNIRVTKEFVEIAKGIPSLGKAEDVGPILKEISEKAPEAYAKLSPILKAMDKRVAEGELFSEIGKSGSPITGSAWERIEKAAEAIVEKDSKVSLGDALDLVCKQHPDWYAEHRKEVA
jgi:hypothetical protein